jgi:hypothetical protein
MVDMGRRRDWLMGAAGGGGGGGDWGTDWDKGKGKGGGGMNEIGFNVDDSLTIRSVSLSMRGMPYMLFDGLSSFKKCQLDMMWFYFDFFCLCQCLDFNILFFFLGLISFKNIIKFFLKLKVCFHIFFLLEIYFN